jgi:hypothetical protein
MKTRFLQNFGGKYAAACEEERRGEHIIIIIVTEFES